jgi:hypothetical protein
LLREVVDRNYVGGIRCASARAAGVNFQACSFNHSDISPFEQNQQFSGSNRAASNSIACRLIEPSVATTIDRVIDTGFDFMLAPLVWLLLLGGMLLAMKAGMCARAAHLRAAPGDPTTFSTVHGAVFALMGLMIAFTFSGAAGRFDHRRDLIVEEANNIGTAYLRIGLLPEATRSPLQEKFRQYLDSRLETYRAGTDLGRVNQLLQQTAELQGQIWKLALEGIDHASSPPVAALILPSLNDMFDIVTTRTAATQMHPPAIVWMMLGGLTLVCSFLVGYDLAGGVRRNWLHVLTFAFLFSLTLYVIIDMEYPRVGLIRVTAMDRVLQNVRDSMR